MFPPHGGGGSRRDGSAREADSGRAADCHDGDAGPLDGGGRPGEAGGVAESEVGAPGAVVESDAGEGPPPSEAFQRLASEVRVGVLRALLAAERRGAAPPTFSELQSAVGADSSAGFAYHLRQLDGHFVRAGEEGYQLTPAGRTAAELVDDGALTGGGSAS